MNQSYFSQWFRRRGLRFLAKRLKSLIARYGLSANRLKGQIDSSVATLARFGCKPTLFVPAVVVMKYSGFFQRLHAAGAEIAVHGNHHVDLSALPLPKARDELVYGAGVFAKLGIEPNGFRCPYLGYSRELLEALPLGLFGYSSNMAIGWENSLSNRDKNPFTETLGRLYGKLRSSDWTCVPRRELDLVEVPVCNPDDLELHDGFSMGSKEMAQIWSELLCQTHSRGELFTLLCHSELISVCERSFIDLLGEAQKLRPSVWIAKVGEISDWWREKSEFEVEIIDSAGFVELCISASPRATILARELTADCPQREWDGTYNLLGLRNLRLRPGIRPFVGIPSNTSTQVISFLSNQGYILDSSEQNCECTVFVDNATLSGFENEIQLLGHIEGTRGPLIRFGRWPGGAKSAMSITCDLDALSLWDYLDRLFC